MKRVLKVFLLILGIAGQARAQWPTPPATISGSGKTSASSTTCSLADNINSGDLMMVTFSWETGTATPTVSDSDTSSTWSQLYLNTSNTIRVAVFKASAASGHSTGTVLTISETGGSFLNTECLRVPANWTATIDGSVAINAFSGTPSTVTVSSVTTTLNTDLMVSHCGGFQSAGTFQVSSAGYVQIGMSHGADSSGLAYKVAGTDGSESVVWNNTTNSQGTCILFALKSNALAFTSPTALPDGSLTNAYSYTLLAAGGAGSFTFSITSGSLQAGLSLNTSTGAITGTPTSSSSNSITFHVTDGTNTANLSATLKVGGTVNTITFVQGKSITGVLTPAAFTSNVAASDLLLVGVGTANLSGNIIGPCTDTLSSSFVLIGQKPYFDGSIGAAMVSIWAAIAPSSGSDTVNCGDGIWGIAEFSNVNFVAADNTCGNNGTTATPATLTSCSLTTLVPGELIFSSCQAWTTGATMTPQSPFANVGSSANEGSDLYQIVTTVTAYTAQCAEASNTSGLWAFALSGLRPSAGAVSASAPPRHRLIL